MYKKGYKTWLLIWPYLIFIVMAIIILWSQYKSRAFFINNDSIFHMHQFYESAMQIKTGHFSWFLDLFGFGQSGRVVNAVYGPVFSYLIGGLLLLVGTWSRTQLILEFLLLFLSSTFMYYLSRKLNFNPILSISLGCIYATSYPILTFLNWQTFDGIGNILLPLIILLGVKMLKSGKVNVVPLAILMAITLQIHVLTTIVATITLIPFALVSYLYHLNKFKFVLHLGMSILLFLVLTCNIWVTMIDVFYKNNIIKPFPNLNMRRHAFQWVNGSFAPFTKSFMIVIILALVLLIITWRKSNLEQKVIPMVAVLFTFLSSAYFPWNQLLQKIPAISQTIQFPERFLGTVVIMILLTIGEGIQLLQTSPRWFSHALVWLSFITLIGCALNSVWLEKNVINGQASRWNHRTTFINNNNAPHINVNVNQIYSSLDNTRRINLAPKYFIKSMPDYLPSNQQITPQNYYRFHLYGATMSGLLGYNVSKTQMSQTGKYNMILHKRSSKPFNFRKSVDSNGLNIEWYQPRSLSHRLITIPLVKYHHTQVTMDHRVIHPSTNQIGQMKLLPRAGYHRLAIHYHAFPGVELVLIFSLMSWICVLGISIDRIIKRNSDEK